MRFESKKSFWNFVCDNHFEKIFESIDDNHLLNSCVLKENHKLIILKYSFEHLNS